MTNLQSVKRKPFLDDERQFQFGQCAQNEVQVELNGGFTESVMNETMVADESNKDRRSNVVNGDTPAKIILSPNISPTNELIANLDITDSTEFTAKLSILAMRSASEEHRFIPPSIDSVEKLFPHPDEVYEESDVDEKAERISLELEEVEVKASSSKFLLGLESGPEIGTTVEEDHGHTVSDPAYSLVQEVFANHEETAGDMDKRIVRVRYMYYRAVPYDVSS
ncbi:hypothetical protein KIN20_016304 [Parelaphostrongylus tenuis]|uniref:Uncharacterized protein n=1 Tax=Parelaphostrongylus tenuis TaxID=148309 RepID=A0AAD5MG88_PARTN|nr:hypothetical protein KIN20_016304 [Parelaphostrongylus tenuis]